MLVDAGHAAPHAKKAQRMLAMYGRGRRSMPTPSLFRHGFVGGRDSDAAMIFMDDLASRLANRVQLTSDGHRAYLEAVEGAFGADVDYAQLVKLYGRTPEGSQRPLQPGRMHRRSQRADRGQPGSDISTSYAER